MQTQPVYNYLTWVKTSFGNSAYNNLASNLEFTRTLKLSDWQLYGSSRLGVYNADTTLTNITFTINGIDSNGNFEVNQVISQTTASINHYDMQHELAYKQFELTSYNGNVLATVLDRKTNNNADIVSANNYYPFHSTMQSFSVANTNSYPYGGANGQMRDDEVFKGAYTALYWEYDSRLGGNGRWNVDPKPNPSISPYAVYAGNPIFFGDLLGDTLWTRGSVADIIRGWVSSDNANRIGFQSLQNPSDPNFQTFVTLNLDGYVAGTDAGMDMLIALVDPDVQALFEVTSTPKGVILNEQLQAEEYPIITPTPYNIGWDFNGIQVKFGQLSNGTLNENDGDLRKKNGVTSEYINRDNSNIYLNLQVSVHPNVEFSNGQRMVPTELGTFMVMYTAYLNFTDNNTLYKDINQHRVQSERIIKSDYYKGKRSTDEPKLTPLKSKIVE